MDTKSQGVIYILTNPSFPDYVKIGYADDVNKRLKELNRSECIPFALKSCGCRRFRWKDLTGQKFGRLEVLEFAYIKDNKNFWKCR